MRGDLAARILGASAPWEPDVRDFLDGVRQQIPFDAMVLAVFHGKHPQIDEVLVRIGLSADAIARWCRGSLEDLSLFRAARRHGVALSSLGESAADMGIASVSDAMLHVVPESLSEPRWWFLLLTNKQRPFSILEQRIAGLLLRQWQVGFNQLREPIVGRLLVGHDDRLIHADPWTQVQLLEDPSMLPQLLQTLRVVVKQRYPSLTQSTMYDFVAQVSERGYWVRFHHDRLEGAPTPDAAEHWYIELHPLEEAELPIIGAIDDERIARAVGYIHENFHQSPSLNQVAAAVHVSPFHFHRLFTKAVGISPKHYLQRKQLQVAKWMLRATREPIGTVAQRTGFSSHGHFTSTFHRLVGMSPSHYREQKC